MPYDGPGIYQHYKGAYYAVLGLSLDEETVVKPGEPTQECACCHGHEWQGVCPESDRVVFSCRMVLLRGRETTRVIYQPLTDGSMLEERREDFWTRKLDDFNETVVITSDPPMPGPRVPRFRKLLVGEVMRLANEQRVEWMRWEAFSGTTMVDYD